MLAAPTESPYAHATATRDGVVKVPALLFSQRAAGRCAKERCLLARDQGDERKSITWNRWPHSSHVWSARYPVSCDGGR